MAADISGRPVEMDEEALAARLEYERHVLPRRKAADVVGDAQGAWGIALSGGGVRSATLCLGIVRGLAKNGLLRQFDYLSTVSGGGYVGASLGRLFGANQTAREVEQGVARDNSMWLWWLRNNGRYLTPAGAKDLGFATASILRGIISTHLEIGILVLILAAMVLLPHILVSLLPPLEAGSLRSLPFVSLLGSVWWWLLPLPLFAIQHQLSAYWYTRDARTVTSSLLVAFSALAGILLSVLLFNTAEARFDKWSAGSAVPTAPIALLYVLSFLSLAPVTAWLATVGELVRKRPVAEQRLRRTKRLAYSLWALAGIFALGLLDFITWKLTAWFWAQGEGATPFRLTAVVALVLAAGRLALPEIQRRLASSKQPSINIEKALNFLGMALALAVAVFWTALLSIALYPSWNRTLVVDGGSALTSAPQVITWLAVIAFCLLYVASTRRSFDLLNLASLHNFYRARIERAYVSSGNCEGPNARFPTSSLHPVSSENTWRVAPLTEAIDGDDVELTDYAPNKFGGPIHLINCCINQSVDDRTGNYSADRKGVSLTVGSMGPETATAFARSTDYVSPPGKLSRWIAVSGAAASTGMGSRTSPGFASLLFLSGLRLGYWTKSLLDAGAATDSLPKRRRSSLLEFAPKPLAIVAESLARFPGMFSSIWYVSDGGHFDNTGIYSLIKRRPRLIIAADCGADPKYLFSDLESLVRKAKIDYGATIEFVDTARLGDATSAELASALGTPETISPEAGSRWLVLGRVQYRDGTEGALLVVKPRRLDQMPFDIVAYADRNPDFPQQSTGDQFFDEAQWEAYHQLGLLLGKRITPSLLRDAQAAVTAMTHAPSSLSDAEAQTRAQAQDPALGRRDRAGLTVRASLGAGISLSVLLATWQGFEQYRESRRNESKDYDALYLSLNDKVQTGKFAGMLPDQFSTFAKQSEALGDKRFSALREKLNLRCEALKDADEKQACIGLFAELTTEPKPFYDYWFADKLARYAAPESPTAVAVAYAGEPMLPGSIDLPATDTALEDGGAESTYVDDIAAPPITESSGPEAVAEAIAEAADDEIPLAAGSPPEDLAEAVAAGPAPSEPIAAAPPPSPIVEAPAAPAPSEPIVETGAAPAPRVRAIVRSASPRPTRAPAAVASVVSDRSSCSATRVFLHIYDESSRVAADRIATSLKQDFGFRTAPIENVVETAKRDGRDPPYVWSSPAIVAHPRASGECAEAILPLLPPKASLRKLPSSIRSNGATLEIWLPPRTGG